MSRSDVANCIGLRCTVQRQLQTLQWVVYSIYSISISSWRHNLSYGFDHAVHSFWNGIDADSTWHDINGMQQAAELLIDLPPWPAGAPPPGASKEDAKLQVKRPVKSGKVDTCWHSLQEAFQVLQSGIVAPATSNSHPSALLRGATITKCATCPWQDYLTGLQHWTRKVLAWKSHPSNSVSLCPLYDPFFWNTKPVQELQNRLEYSWKQFQQATVSSRRSTKKQNQENVRTQNTKKNRIKTS